MCVKTIGISRGQAKANYHMYIPKKKPSTPRFRYLLKNTTYYIFYITTKTATGGSWLLAPTPQTIYIHIISMLGSGPAFGIGIRSSLSVMRRRRCISR